jgi:Family of unknown function (DUF6325)
MSEDAVSLDTMGPIDYLILQWPTGRASGGGFPVLVDLADRGLIRILDLAFVRKEADGSVTRLAFDALPVDGDVDATVFEGVSSGILTDDDFADAAAVVDAGAVVGILVYENAWAAPFAVAVRRGGGQLLADGRIPVQAVIAALDVTEPSA